MTDYTKLIAALRHCANDAICSPCEYDPQVCRDGLMNDAANAIESLSNASKTLEQENKALKHLVDLNTERCEGLRKQLREAQDGYEKHLSELEQQIPKRGERGDLINRNDVYKLIQDSFNKGDIRWMAGQDLMNRINALPASSPWHRVEDELPRGQELVIVAVKDTAGDTPFWYTQCGWITTDGEYWIVDNEICDYVVAWMSLPEPPKED